MGLLDSVLNVPERLRVWQQSGVHYLFWDPAQAATPATSEPPEASSALPDSAAAPDASAAPPAPATSAQSGERDAGPGVDASAETPTRPAAPVLEADPDPATWPEAWAALLAKTPARPHLVITYRELGDDLSGRSDPRRGKLWRALIRDLGLAGRHAVAFWPFALPVGQALEPRPDLFWAGIRRLAPRQIALFGQDAVDLLGPGAPPDGSVRLAGLPDPLTLLAGDTEVWKHVLATLGQPDLA